MNILFVCTGNTCRSPMAEALFKVMAEKAGMDKLHAASAGIAAFAGGKASHQAVRVMEELGINLSDHRAAQVNDKLLKQADLILTMTEEHKNAIQAETPSVWNKIHTLKEYSGMEGGKNISDPFGRSDEAYRQTAREIQNAIEKLLDRLK